MTPIEQHDACLCFFEPTDPASKDGQRTLLTELAKSYRFRLVFLQRQTLAAKAGYLSQRIDSPGFGGLKTNLISNWLFCRHRPILMCFLSAAGIPNKEGLVENDSPSTQADRLAKGIEAIRERFPRRYVGLYLGYLLYAEGDTWQELPAAMEHCGLSIPELLGAENVTSVSSTGATHKAD